MTVLSKPTDIARETLRMLVMRKQAPTPENYARLYCEIGGVEAEDNAAATIEPILQRLAAEIPRSTPELARLGAALSEAHANRKWEVGHRAIINFARQQSDTVSATEWSTLLRELARLLSAQSPPGLCAERQAELEKALKESTTTQLMYGQFFTLAQKWATATPVLEVHTGGAACAANDGHGGSGPITAELRELLAGTLDQAIGAALIDAPDLVNEAQSIAQTLRAPAALEMSALLAQLKTLWRDVGLRNKERDGIQQGLLQLLRLLVDNIGELVADDQWLRGQIGVVAKVISGPLDLVAIEEAQRNLRNVIKQQGLLKQSLNATKSTLKEMVSSFIDELGKLSTATGDYHDSIEGLAQQIRQTEDVNQLNVLLEEVLRETRSVQASTLASRKEVLRAREQVHTAELKIKELESQIEQISDKVLHDHLTGTLNRRGLDVAFEREIAVANRHGKPLSIALLDIDNFKELNDKLGHQAGDDALVHLSQVIKETMRPSDSVARYGGEEFIIVLPDSDTAQGVTVITRLQRDLTKTFFLNENGKLLITFSAGIATYQPGDSRAAVIARADRALYQAKRTGKNRVVAAEPSEPRFGATAAVSAAAA